MKYRKLGKTNWEVSEIGYGMWGMAGWTGSDDEESMESMQLAVDSGCNFFDTPPSQGKLYIDPQSGFRFNQRDEKGW